MVFCGHSIKLRKKGNKTKQNNIKSGIMDSYGEFAF